MWKVMKMCSCRTTYATTKFLLVWWLKRSTIILVTYFVVGKGLEKEEAGVWGPPLKKGQSVVVVAKDRRRKMGGVGCTVHSTRLLSHRGGFMFKYYGTVDRH